MKIEDIAKRLCKGRILCLEPACVELCGDCQDILDSCLDGVREGLKIARCLAGAIYSPEDTPPFDYNRFNQWMYDILDGKADIPEEESAGE